MNRGVDKRPIVLSDRDRLRFVNNLRLLNNAQRTDNLGYFLKQSAEYEREHRERLVTIHAWCLMGNHYHLLLSDALESGMSRFLHKLNMAYSKYFNVKHNRSGALFQGNTKRVLIESDRQFLYILPYIHLNPLDFMKGGTEWRQQCLANPKTALKWVTKYRWSSYRNYKDEKEFSEILEGSELFGDRETHVRELEYFIRSAPDTELTTLNLE